MFRFVAIFGSMRRTLRRRSSQLLLSRRPITTVLVRTCYVHGPCPTCTLPPTISRLLMLLRTRSITRIRTIRTRHRHPRRQATRSLVIRRRRLRAPWGGSRSRRRRTPGGEA